MENGVPPELRGHRTLAAVVFTDGVSFSARMSVAEEQTLELINRDLKLMGELCGRFEGHVLKSTGDGLLMYFTSALAAVTCAIAMQKALAEAAEGLSPQDVLTHRIGIHLGDIFFSEDDVMGNGVNIAARLQTLAVPGGICLSQTVYDVVKSSLPLAATYLGPKELKNITEAVPVYQILLTPLADSLPQKSLPTAAKSRQDYRDRQILLNKVKNYWIKGVLETSLHDKALIELGLEERLNAVDRPWGLEWESPEADRQPLPQGTRILDPFKSLGVGRTLLILGDPGSGKTTTLLELTRDLIATAEQDFYHLIPVVFNLSSWAGGKQAIADWLVQELYTKYQVSKEIGRHWITHQHLLLMLDGLDEVNSANRAACVNALNQFHQEYGQTEIVICCRIKDYESLNTRLRFQGAIYLQPLNFQQIQTYLEGIGESLAPLRHALNQDTQLQQLAQSPLILNIMAIAYQGMPLNDLPQPNSSDAHQHLFNTYIERMFQRKLSSPSYSKSQAMTWLIWLAKRMSSESQTVFLIERMQPQWLPNKWTILLYKIAILGAYFLLCGSILQHFLSGGKLIICLIIGAGLYWSIFGLQSIQPLESLKWSWNRAKIYLPAGLIGGPIFGIFIKLLYELIANPLHWQIFTDASVDFNQDIIQRGLVFGLSLGVLFGLIRGLTGPGIDQITIPNQSIRQSAKNSLIFGIMGISVMSTAAMSIGWNPFFWGSFGLIIGMAAGGGEACLKHLILRIMLYIQGYIPWNYAHFLDWATERIFLQRVGGGYIFIHRLLLEHFASLNFPPPKK